MATVTLSSAMDSIRERLCADHEIDDVIVDTAGALWLMCQPDGDRSRIESMTRQILTEHGIDDHPRIELVVRASAYSRERVRFDGVDRSQDRDSHAQIKVRLEWQGKVATGEATGERGDPIEMRTAATAALRALDAILDAPLDARLIGVKQVRAFDADLTVVSLSRGEGGHKLVGIVLTGEDPRRAAAVAVLNALNRSLGNRMARGF